MTALVNSLKRIWYARNRRPHRTGWGPRGSQKNITNTTLIGSVYESFLALTGVARQTAPTILVVVWNIFR